MKVWDELHIVQDIPACTCNDDVDIHKYLEDQRIIKLLVGLNDTYKALRAHILMMKHLPSVAIVYSMIIQEGR